MVPSLIRVHLPATALAPRRVGLAPGLARPLLRQRRSTWSGERRLMRGGCAKDVARPKRQPSNTGYSQHTLRLRVGPQAATRSPSRRLRVRSRSLLRPPPHGPEHRSAIVCPARGGGAKPMAADAFTYEGG